MSQRDGHTGGGSGGGAGGGGFKFDDEEPSPKKKQPKFEFSVEEVKEEDTKRRARVKEPFRVQAAPPPDPAMLRTTVPEGGDAGRFEWPMVGIVILLLPLVYWLQQWTRGLHNETLDEAPAEVRMSEDVDDPGITGLTVMSKLSVKMAFLMEQHGERPQNQTMAQMEDEAKKNRKDSWRRGPAPPPPLPPQAQDEDAVSVSDLESMAWTRIDRLRVAIVAGELDGAQAALERLDALQKETDAASDLAAEIHWLVRIYREGPDVLTDEAVESLRARHGWFGRLALSFSKHQSDDNRWEVASGGDRLIVGQILVIVGLVLTSLAGLIVGVLLVVKYRRTGYLVRFIAPEPGGSVYLETFGVFLGGFALLLLMELFFFGLRAEGTITAAAFQEVLLWSLVLTAAWPVVRGVAWREWLNQMGWHKGEGYFREILAGCVGFLGAQPVGWIGGRIGAFVETATDSAESEPSFGYGLFEMPTEATGLLFWLGVLSAVVWAPVVEESIFRGALFRHLTGRMNMIWAAAVSALCFGLIHPYTPAGLIEVAAGGFVYALIRAWRGSLIAPVVAHALHNTVASSLDVYFVTMLGD